MNYICYFWANQNSSNRHVGRRKSLAEEKKTTSTWSIFSRKARSYHVSNKYSRGTILRNSPLLWRQDLAWCYTYHIQTWFPIFRMQ
jgi:hypothetical protein